MKSIAKKVAIIQGHPDPSGNRLCHALADAYAEGALSTGALVDRIEVGLIDFPLLRTQDEFNQGTVGIPESLIPAQLAIAASNTLMFTFPLWHGTLPALLKGFLEQIMRPGVAMDYGDGRFPKPLLKGKSARIVMTMGMPVFFFRWYFGAHGLKFFEKSVLRFAGIKPIRESLFGSVESVSDATRKRWLEQMRLAGRSDAR
jgi:putative NADPH-quinone reductase